ncbi:MAG TPA: lipoprotein [Burkholderiaceae bacterium]|jgi:predicted small lipoprotein YifL
MKKSKSVCLLALAGTLGLLLTLSACGQKGPLYLPKDGPAKSARSTGATPVPASSPASAATSAPR